MGDTATGQSTYTMESLYKAVQERFHVFHFHVTHGGSRGVPSNWENLLGQHVIKVDDHNDIPHMMAKIITSNYTTQAQATVTPVDVKESDTPTTPLL
jgi:hypothetical protein